MSNQLRCSVCLEPMPAGSPYLGGSGDAYFDHFKSKHPEVLGPAFRPPSAEPHRKRKTFPLSWDTRSDDEDLLSRMIALVDDGNLLYGWMAGGTQRWNYLDKGCVYAFLSQVQGVPDVKIAGAFGQKPNSVTMAINRALQWFDRSCECHRNKIVLSIPPLPCPHTCGRLLFYRSVDSLWLLIAAEAADNGLLVPELAAAIGRVKLRLRYVLNHRTARREAQSSAAVNNVTGSYDEHGTNWVEEVRQAD